MKQLFENLILAGRHLYILDCVFRENYDLYKEVITKLESIILYDEIQKEIYVGGKKRGKHGYGRQMILGDILQYILTGRGYYFAIRDQAHMEAFIRILMHISNLLILMENTSVDVELRNKVLDKLEQEIGSHFFEDSKQESKFRELRKFEGKIVPGDKEARRYEDAFDSIFPKRIGGVSELLVYTYLVRKNFGYVLPLLQSQRLLGNQGYIIPPDFLLLRSKGEVFGLEVGGGKERQIASFSTLLIYPF